MIIWINGPFGAGKTQTAYELHRRLPGSAVFDPENAGYYIRKNVPRELSKGDFQDYPMWREINYTMHGRSGKTGWRRSSSTSVFLDEERLGTSYSIRKSELARHT